MLDDHNAYPVNNNVQWPMVSVYSFNVEVTMKIMED